VLADFSPEQTGPPAIAVLAAASLPQHDIATDAEAPVQPSCAVIDIPQPACSVDATVALAFFPLMCAAHSLELMCAPQPAAVIIVVEHHSQPETFVPVASMPPNAAMFRMGAAPGATTADLIMLL
jgi:hypothetical protein